MSCGGSAQPIIKGVKVFPKGYVKVHKAKKFLEAFPNTKKIPSFQQ
jgi:hypothetical protein